MSAKLAKLPGNGQQDVVGNVRWGSGFPPARERRQEGWWECGEHTMASLDSRLRGKDGRRGEGTESEFMRYRRVWFVCPIQPVDAV